MKDAESDVKKWSKKIEEEANNEEINVQRIDFYVRERKEAILGLICLYPFHGLRFLRANKFFYHSIWTPLSGIICICM